TLCPIYLDKRTRFDILTIIWYFIQGTIKKECRQMFENASAKIKVWAKIVTWIGIFASVIAGFVMISGGASMGYYYARSSMVVPGILIMVIGSLLSWVNGLFIYNFGDIAGHADSVHADMDLLLAQNKAQMDDLLAAVRSLEKYKAE
ncbi:MAG: hypothetical protein PHY64_03400, partial [Eubacteriales bacterium]|nr:hypothetical protein [Eubacteriales bacterium]